MLERLLGADRALGAGELAWAVGTDAGGVTRIVEALRGWGCEIGSHPHEGFRLERVGLGCWADYLEHRHGAGVGRRVLVYRQTDSTQDVARQLVEGAASVGALDGTVVVADEQAAGRGRLGRKWEGARGGQLLLTVVVDAGAVDRLMLATADAVAATAEGWLGGVGVRWPNDVMVGGKKLAGVLVERVAGASLVGIGMNVGLDVGALPSGLRDVATSFDERGVAVDRLAVLDRLVSELDRALGASDGVLAAAWRERNVLTDRVLTVESDGKVMRGRVIDIDPAKGLLLDVEGGGVVVLGAAVTSLVHGAI